MFPLSFFQNLRSNFKNVDLPQPDSPTIPTISPLLILKSTFDNIFYLFHKSKIQLETNSTNKNTKVETSIAIQIGEIVCA